MEDDIGRLVVGAAMVGGVYFAGLCLSRLPRVWRGTTLGNLPLETLRGPRVEHRSYPVFTIWLNTFVAGLVVLLVGTLVRVAAVAAIGVLLVLTAMFVVFPLWLLSTPSTARGSSCRPRGETSRGRSSEGRAVARAAPTAPRPPIGSRSSTYARCPMTRRTTSSPTSLPVAQPNTAAG